MKVDMKDVQEDFKRYQAEIDELKEAIIDINSCYKNSTGYEPSLSVFHRSLYEAMQLTEPTNK